MDENNTATRNPHRKSANCAYTATGIYAGVNLTYLLPLLSELKSRITAFYRTHTEVVMCRLGFLQVAELWQ
jgi:hypothetical protein